MIRFLVIGLLALMASCSNGSVAGSEAGNARVAMTVYSSDSIPAADVPVLLYSAGGDSLVDSTASNDSGFVAFDHLNAGLYQVYCYVNDEVILVTVEASDAPDTVADYLEPVSYLAVTDSVPYVNDGYLLSLVGTPVHDVPAVRLNDSTLLFAGLPAGRFAVGLTGPNVTLETADSVVLISSDTVGLSPSLLFLSAHSFGDGLQTVAANDSQLFVGGSFGGLLLSRDTGEYLKLQADGGVLAGSKITSAEILLAGIFVGTDSGLAYCQSGVPVYSENCGTVFDIAAVSDTLVYVCSEKDGIGVVRSGVYDGRIVDTVSTVPLLPPCVYPLNDTAIYVGSKLRGLYHWSSAEGITRDTSFIGWNSLYVNDVEVGEDGSIWLITPSSLRRKLPDSTWEIHLSSIGFSSSCKTPDGKLWFGGNDGNLYTWNGSAVVPVISLPSPILKLAVGPNNAIVGVLSDRAFIFKP